MIQAESQPSLLTSNVEHRTSNVLCRVVVHAPLGRRLFLYECPPALGPLSPGDAVLVPFGGREILGWVIQPAVDPGEVPEEERPRSVKPVIERVEGAGVRAEDVKLCEILHAWYGTNFSDILALFVPSAAPKVTRCLERTGPDSPVPYSSSASELVRQLDEAGGTLPLKKSARSMKSTLKELTASGAFAVRTRVVETRPARKTFVGPSDTIPDASRMSDLHKKILDISNRHPFKFGPAELAKLAHASPKDVRDLVSNRIIIERTLRHWRVPLERVPLERAGDVRRPTSDVRRPTQSQALALENILPAVAARTPARFLLFGPTASGKTFVYEEAAKACLAQGRQVLLMVPEIALTRPLVERILESIPEPIAVIHSRLGPAERRDEWQRCAAGSARLLVGPRSAAFVPLPELGLAIIDECHDAGYKDAKSPYLDARKVVEEKCALQNAPLILGSATPSVEQLYAAGASGIYRRLDLSEFPTRPARPEVSVVDLRKNAAAGHDHPEYRRTFLTPELQDMIDVTLSRNEAAVLLLNRRGFAPQVSCPACGYSARCESCLLGLTYHLQERRLMCHGCGRTTAPAGSCPACGYTPLGYFGVGTERVVEAVQRRFPKAKIARLDQDAFRNRRKEAFGVLESLRLGQIDILIGTQLIAKGLDIPRVTLAAVILADVGLNLPDYRSSERTFQLLAQCVGRSGRHDAPGRAVIQTFQPTASAIRRSLAEETMEFFSEEIRNREEGQWPPFVRLASILVQSENAPLALATAREIHEHLVSTCPSDVRLSPPLPAGRPKIDGEYRFQMILRTSSGSAFPPGVYEKIVESFRHPKLKIHFEPDPISLL